MPGHGFATTWALYLDAWSGLEWDETTNGTGRFKPNLGLNHFTPGL